MGHLMTRTISEQFCRLAALLEAEALRGSALHHSHQSTTLYREALELRDLADTLWQMNSAVSLEVTPKASASVAACAARLRRGEAFSTPGQLSRDDLAQHPGENEDKERRAPVVRMRV